MDISDKIIEEKWKMFLKVEKESKKEDIIKSRKMRRGYESFCDMLHYMTTEELKDLAHKKSKELDNPNLNSEEEAKLYGEIIRIAEECRDPNRTVKTNKKSRWFEDYGFIISYGEDGKIIPVGDVVTYKQLELYNGSLERQEYEKLSEEEKKKTLEAVFSNEKGDLKLRIPVGSLMELRDILEKYAVQELEDNEETAPIKSLSLDDLDATIESIDDKGKSTLLGNNYIVYPLEIDKNKEKLKEKDKDTSNELER